MTWAKSPRLGQRRLKLKSFLTFLWGHIENDEKKFFDENRKTVLRFGPENARSSGLRPFFGLGGWGGPLCRTPAALPAVSTLQMDSRGIVEGS